MEKVQLVNVGILTSSVKSRRLTCNHTFILRSLLSCCNARRRKLISCNRPTKIVAANGETERHECREEAEEDDLGGLVNRK